MIYALHLTFIKWTQDGWGAGSCLSLDETFYVTASKNICHGAPRMVEGSKALLFPMEGVIDNHKLSVSSGLRCYYFFLDQEEIGGSPGFKSAFAYIFSSFLVS